MLTGLKDFSFDLNAANLFIRKIGKDTTFLFVPSVKWSCGNLTEYIKKSSLEDIKFEMKNNRGHYIQVVYMGDVDRLPIEDVSPILHAKWIVIDNNQPISKDKIYTCSNCRKSRLFKWQLTNFCSHCGALMDKG